MSWTELSAHQAAALIRTGELSSEAMVGAALERISERDGLVGAWAHVKPELALEAARRADRAVKSGAVTGALHGVPVGIKDIIDTADLPTENGCIVFAGRQPEHDASVVAQLRSAGAVILGKTVTTELAFFGPGKTRNPRNPEHTPGGSSSGSAAAVADFHVPIALGTQTAGSILRPASYCGVIGFKPTFGRVSRRGVLAQSVPLDTIGGYARSIPDVALLLDCMSAPDPRDPAMSAKAPASLRECLARGLEASPRFAFVKTPAWPDGDAAMRAAMEGFVARLGARSMEVAMPSGFETSGGLQRAVQFRDIARAYGPILDANPGRMSAKLAEVIGIGRGVSDSEYLAALGRREALYAAFEPVLSEYDAILTPAAQGTAPRGLQSTGSPMFNFLWTYLGMPAISLPLLEVEGMPLGVQLVGRRGEDGRLLAVAHALMSELPAPAGQ